VSKTTHVYAAEIAKSYRNDDGDLVVEGIATSSDLDLDQQVCDPDWLKTAMPEWFKWGNVREQHGNIAAGTGTDLADDDGKWKLTSLVTDPVAAHKVETKTYRGYSIGIRDPRVIRDKAAPGGRIVGGSIVEISLVDRPCNPVATLSLAKAASPAVQKAAVVDTARMLVKVEEIAEHPENADKSGDPIAIRAAADAEPVEKAAPRYPGTPESIAGLVKELKPRTQDRAATIAHIVGEAQRLKRAELLPADLVKTAQHDPAMIGSIRDGLVACINAELQELCDGEPELCDIEQLFSSLWTLMSWWEDEAWQGETASPYTGDLGNEVALWLAAQPEQEKAMGDTKTEVTTDTTKTAESDTGKAAETAGTLAVPEKLTELVKAAVAEATKDSDERVKALEAELAKVKATPVPGGPAITHMSTGNADAAVRAEKSARFQQLASQVADPDLRAYYRAELKKLAQNGSES
jgi:hypothetical protein